MSIVHKTEQNLHCFSVNIETNLYFKCLWTDFWVQDFNSIFSLDSAQKHQKLSFTHKRWLLTFCYWYKFNTHLKDVIFLRVIFIHMHANFQLPTSNRQLHQLSTPFPIVSFSFSSFFVIIPPLFYFLSHKKIRFCPQVLQIKKNISFKVTIVIIHEEEREWERNRNFVTIYLWILWNFFLVYPFTHFFLLLFINQKNKQHQVVKQV